MRRDYSENVPLENPKGHEELIANTGKVITLMHGSGGLATHNLVRDIFLPFFRNQWLEPLDDSATISFNGKRLAITTDGFTVEPLFFPGGDIGSLAVHGTVNDLATAGARPLFIAASFVLEEGLAMEDLQKIVISFARACQEHSLSVVTGDTKVVPAGKGGGVYIATTGVGIVETDYVLSISKARPGDRVLLSGTIGDHGAAVLMARGHLELESEIRSDSAGLWTLVETVIKNCPHVHCLRDPTRGGLAAVLNEIARASQVSIRIREETIPIKTEVSAACEILGLDPLYLACEGKMVFVAGPEDAERALQLIRSHPLGTDAALIGEVTDEEPGLVLMETTFGGLRQIDMLMGDPLPRIC
ncbi:MAG: hydrogenase expression/formation protein HypE [Armatimonadetes bacterium]|nr:hydrogenase expression/formation protein HypE [Armatimonadota bacterium]MDW8122401.1 hydrogenase expression/formation protein HypE [Armatimonadota bacterium]